MAKMMRVPDELVELIEKVQNEALKQGYSITLTEAIKIIVKSYKSK